MCGIAGLVYLDGRKPTYETLKCMTDIIEHRGPDDTGFWAEGSAGLGFCRLSIIDLKEGHQPLANEDDSVWIVFNGEIYNYKALRKDLQAKGHVFKTETDTEVIVHLYEEYGEQCVDHLRGMFGFAIWDRNREQLFVARDHFGIKPLYYWLDNRQFVFGSEIKSLLQIEGVQREMDQEALLQYLTFQYVPEPLTLFAGIRKLPPGHCMLLKPDGSVKMRAYWDPQFVPVDRPFEEYVEKIREKLKESVTLHMQSDVLRGCFLSSGIDSTAIATMMRSIEPIKTFSVGFEGAQNETVIARQTAEALGTDHYDKVISEADFFDSVPKAIWHQDEPVADPSAIALYHVAKLAREHVTVVLSGEGADELFGGYRIYREPGSLRPLAWLPEIFRVPLHKLAEALPASVKGRNYLLRATTPLEQRFLGNARIFSEQEKGPLFAGEAGVLNGYKKPFDLAGDYYSKTKHLDPVTRMQYIDMKLWLPGDILMKADKMTMANSLELRVPFLDKEVFELARQIPTAYRLAQGTTKYVLRKAMAGVIPDFILDRPKLGFPVPLRHWLKQEAGLRILEEIRASGIDRYLHLSQVERMLEAHRRGEGDYARHIWTIYVLAQWYVTYMIPQPASRPQTEQRLAMEGRG